MRLGVYTVLFSDWSLEDTLKYLTAKDIHTVELGVGGYSGTAHADPDVLLNNAGVETSLEILDEPAHFMAPAGVRDLTEFLMERAETLAKRIFFVDHMSIEGSQFSSVTTVTKDVEGSHIGLSVQ